MTPSMVEEPRPVYCETSLIKLMNAPPEIEAETLDKAESFAEDCQWVSVYQLREGGRDEPEIGQRIHELRVRFSTAAESAEELRNEAESAKKRV